MLAEPVLVWLSGTLSGPREIYDQTGKLLAFRKRQDSDSRSRIENLLGWRGVDLLDNSGQTQLHLSPDSFWTPRLFKATAPDGKEIGEVIVAQKGRGSMLAAGATVGCLKRPPGLSSRLDIGHARGRYTLYNADDDEVGRITHRTTWLQGNYNVIEIDDRASETFRALVLAASAAVDFWQRPKE